MIHAPLGEGGGFVTRRPKSGHEEFLGEIKLSHGSGSSISNLGVRYPAIGGSLSDPGLGIIISLSGGYQSYVGVT